MAVNSTPPACVGTSYTAAATEVRAKVLRVDAVAGKLSLSLKPSAVGGGASPDEEDMDEAGGSGSESDDLDDEMAARLEAIERGSDGEEVGF